MDDYGNYIDGYLPLKSEYTTHFVHFASWFAPDFVIAIGVVILDHTEQKVMVLRDAQGIFTLPRVMCIDQTVGEVLKSPFVALQQKAGCDIKQIPVHAVKRKYKDAWIEDPSKLEIVAEPCGTTTNPFYTSLDVYWNNDPELPWLDSKQCVTLWIAASASERSLSADEPSSSTSESPVVDWLPLTSALDTLTEQSPNKLSCDILALKQFMALQVPPV